MVVVAPVRLHLLLFMLNDNNMDKRNRLNAVNVNVNNIYNYG